MTDRHDDQVDALLLFLDWLVETERYFAPVIAAPVIVRRSDFGWYDPWANRL